MAKKTSHSPPKPQPSRPIKKFSQPAPAAPPPNKSANDLVDEAVRIAKNPPGIDGRQQRY